MPHWIKHRTKHIINIQGQTTYMFMCTYPCRYADAFVHVSIQARGQHQGSSIALPADTFFWNGSLAEHKLAGSALWIHLSLSPPCSWYHMGPGELNSGPHACATQTLLTIPSPQPQTESLIFPWFWKVLQVTLSIFLNRRPLTSNPGCNMELSPLWETKHLRSSLQEVCYCGKV